MRLGEEVCGEVFDTVVVGTGLSETAVACALTLDDPEKKVLVLDPASYYGGLEATVQPRELVADPDAALEDESAGLCGWKVLGVDGALSNDEARRCNLDLRPRLVLCRGRVVDALVRSGVSKYLEFQSLDDALFLDADGTVMRVPCSKAAVFKSKDLGMAEKRQLMRFLQYCMDSATVERAGGQVEALRSRNEESLNQGRSLARPQNKKEAVLAPSATADDEDVQDFADFLRNKCGLSPRLAAAILYAVALLPDARGVSTQEGMLRVQKYLGGLGRFGVTAFLCPMYGTAELSQAFGRLGSVHGGLFVLRQPVASLEPAQATEAQDESIVKLHLKNGETVQARNVVAAEHALPSTADITDASGPVEVRRICVANAPLVSVAGTVETDKIETLLNASALRGHPVDKRVFPPLARCLLVVAPESALLSNPASIHVVQLDSTAEAAAPGLFAVHLTTTAPTAANGQAILDRLLEDLLARARARLESLPKSAAADADADAHASEKPNADDALEQQIEIRWQASLARPVHAMASQDSGAIPGVTTIASQDHAVDTEDFIATAETVFHALRPDERAFLPAESERQVRNPHTEEDDGVGDMVKRVRVPQPVDLRWFVYLGGSLGSSGTTVSLI